jgi:hypothetical protein
MLKRMSHRTFLKWSYFDEFEPIGSKRFDYLFGMLASLIANVNRDGKKKPEAYTIEDFMLFVERPPKPPKTWQESKKLLFRALKRSDPKPRAKREAVESKTRKVKRTRDVPE